MKDLKEIILEKRVREFKVDGKKVPDKYVNAFNDYLKQIAEQLKTHDREVVKEVCNSIRGVCRLNFRTYKKHLPEDCEKYKEVNAFNKAILGVLEFIDKLQKEYEK